MPRAKSQVLVTERKQPMSQRNVIKALNRLLANECHSLIDYLGEAPPWTHAGNEDLVALICRIQADHRQYAQDLADAIVGRDGCPAFGSYPSAYLSLNDLALDYLLPQVVRNQRYSIQVTEQCIGEMIENPHAEKLARNIKENQRSHLEMLREFLPKPHVIPNGHEDLSHAA